MKTSAVQAPICRGVVALLFVTFVTACGGQQQEAPANTAAAPPAAAPAATPPAASPSPSPSSSAPERDAPIPDTPSPFDALPEGVRGLVDRPFAGDLDEMIKRRMIRVAVTFNRTHYFRWTSAER